MDGESVKTSRRRRPVEAAAPETQSAPSAAEVAALAPMVEAVLLSLDRPVTAERLAEGLRLVQRPPGDEEGTQAEIDPAQMTWALVRVDAAIALLNEQYTATGRAFRIEAVAGGHRVMTLPAFAERIADFHQARLAGKLSRAALETLAIIAYKQPITRATLEAIRGVSCGEVLKSLMDRRLVTVKGRAEELGRPMLYGTTKSFLDQFGLTSIKDLPTLAELKPGV